MTTAAAELGSWEQTLPPIVAPEFRPRPTHKTLRKIGGFCLDMAHRYESPVFKRVMEEPTLYMGEHGTVHAVRILNEHLFAEGTPPIIVTNALALKSDSGYMRRRLYDLAVSINRPIINVSSEGFEGGGLNVSQLKALSFEQATDTIMAILEQLSGQYAFDTVDFYGESRGSMIGLLAASMKSKIKINRVIGAAPCGIKVAGPKVALAYVRQFLTQEPLTVVKHLLRHPTELPHLLPTPIIPLDAWPSVVKTCVDVFAGPLKGLQINPETEVVLRVYRKDIASYPRKWQEFAAEYPNVTVEVVDGTHLSILERSTVDFATRHLHTP